MSVCARTHTHTHTQNNRRDSNTRSRYKRAWHSGLSLEHITWSSFLGRKVDAHQTSHQILAMGKEWERDLQKKKALGKGGGGFLSHLPCLEPLAKINSHNLVLIRHSSMAGVGIKNTLLLALSSNHFTTST